MLALALLYLLSLALAGAFFALRWSLAWRVALVFLWVALGLALVVATPGLPALAGGGALVAAGFVARALWQLGRRPTVGRAPRWIDPALVAGFAVLGAVSALIALSWRTVGQGAGPLHVALALGAVLALGGAWAVKHRLLRALGAGLALGLGAMVLYSAAVHPARVLATAGARAQGAHCLSFQGLGRAARSRGELTFFTMDKSPAWSRLPHVVLVGEAGPIAHWSYRTARFVPDADAALLTYCNPAGARGLATAPDDGTVLATLRGAAFRVPRAYDPMPSTGGHLAISLDPVTMEPDPAAGPSAWIALGQAEDLDDLAAAGRGIGRGPFGLETVDGTPPDSPFTATTDLYMHRDRGGVTTRIECWDTTCLHRFSPNGIDRIIFNHEREDLVRWRAMQTGVAELFESFRQ